MLLERLVDAGTFGGPRLVANGVEHGVGFDLLALIGDDVALLLLFIWVDGVLKQRHTEGCFLMMQTKCSQEGDRWPFLRCRGFSPSPSCADMCVEGEGSPTGNFGSGWGKKSFIFDDLQGVFTNPRAVFSTFLPAALRNFYFCVLSLALGRQESIRVCVLLKRTTT